MKDEWVDDYWLWAIGYRNNGWNYQIIPDSQKPRASSALRLCVRSWIFCLLIFDF